MFVHFFNMSFVTQSWDRLTKVMVLSKVATSQTFILSSPELGNISIAFPTGAGVHSFLGFEEGAALRFVMVQTGPGNLSNLSRRLSACSLTRIWNNTKLQCLKNYPHLPNIYSYPWSYLQLELNHSWCINAINCTWSISLRWSRKYSIKFIAYSCMPLEPHMNRATRGTGPKRGLPGLINSPVVMIWMFDIYISVS